MIVWPKRPSSQGAFYDWLRQLYDAVRASQILPGPNQERRITPNGTFIVPRNNATRAGTESLPTWLP